ncbi:MAG: ABC transporter ATP-binding protein [Alphaproteobacteria bacterium]|jgi:branched-chain amino acid transport system ATP-binding protein|nr:ABC transporter ATP-binding protein [Alphaproteobacteria bacterium]MDP6565481.1 ABC transporter ATP-binding protein [Alphaproteobacteria bacterium]MDP6815090.1 ABC transporter ATP-binding protein [Alphaproteobacteria bacterium]
MAAVELLATTALNRHFGGLQAVRDVQFSLRQGEIRGLIGPNGAGKTTLVGMISGRLRASSGGIAFKGRDITRLKSWQRVALGIVYTFQVTSIYPNLSCYENLALAVQRRLPGGLAIRFGGGEGAIAGRVAAALARVGLEEDRDRLAGELPYGHQRLLEVAMGLALEPELLILDEPTQGLAEGEIAQFCTLVREIAEGATGATVLLIEHNMEVVLDLAERITVMDRGAVIAEGTAAEIQGDAQVQRAYLGT